MTDPERRLVSILTDRVLWHGESMLRDGERVGHVTSAALAPTLDAFAGLAWVHGALDGDWCVVREHSAPSATAAGGSLSMNDAAASTLGRLVGDPSRGSWEPAIGCPHQR